MSVSKRIFAAVSSAVLVGCLGLVGWLGPAGGVAVASAPVPEMPVPAMPVPAMVDTDVSFQSRGHTFYGTYRGPADSSERPVAAALLLPGSGPVDRNGVAGRYRAQTLLHLADALAARGVASFRFDKYGTGQTGTDGPAASAMADYGFEHQVDDASAALAELEELAGTDARHTAVLGHSEGALTALVVRERQPDVVGGVGLLQPLPMRYLDLVRAQIHAYVDRSLRSGEMEPGEGDRILSSVEETIDALRTEGAVPDDQHPLLPRLGLSPTNARFLSEADQYDPRALAADVPASTHNLLSCSDKDLNVSCEQVEELRAALDHTDLDFVHMTTSNHGLGELGPVPPTQFDSVLPLPLSFEFTAALNTWIDGLVQQ